MESSVFPEIAKSDPPPPYAQITVTAPQQIDTLGRAIRNSFQDAMAMRGVLNMYPAAFEVHGFSGKKFRMLLNNLMSELADPRYLEIGLYHGASFCSALYMNEMRAVGVDNWTEYGGERSRFDQNLDRYVSNSTDVEILEMDFRKIDYGNIGKFNVLFFDGPHTEQDQYDGVFYPALAMDDEFILIVDDWNWERVRNGTFNALNDAGMTVEYSIEVRTSFDGELPLVRGAKSEWHNGALIAVVSKSPRMAG